MNTRPETPPAKSEQIVNARQAILAAALRAFAQSGFEGASLPRIARAAGVGAPLIHYHFGAKDRLWREVVDHSLADLRRDAAAIRDATSALAPMDRLRALLQTITHFAARCPDHFVMTMAEARSGSDRFAWLQENYSGVIFADIVTLLSQAKAQGLIKDVAVDQLATMLVGAIFVRFSLGPVAADEAQALRLANTFTDLMFMLLSHGVLADPHP